MEQCWGVISRLNPHFFKSASRVNPHRIPGKYLINILRPISWPIG
jgi:hypothetical protein